jgi:diguanylate cyclase (GGDEF)-like protein
MPTRERKILRAGYGIMAALTLLIVVAAALRGVRYRDPLLAAVLTVGWWVCIACSRSRLRMAEEAASDPLTGLYTRRHLAVLLQGEMSRTDRYGGAFSVAILDLDEFKALNDERGHLCGDESLRAFADAIRAVLRQSDLAFRYGGDECVVLFPGTGASAAAGVLDRLRQVLPQVPFSGGIAEYPGDGPDALALLGVADARLMEAKGAGKDRLRGSEVAR